MGGNGVAVGIARALAAINNQAARGENCRSRTVSRATGGQGWKLNRPSSRAALISGAHTWMREMSARRGKYWWGSRQGGKNARGGGGTRRRRRDAAARTRTGQRLGLHHERTCQQPLERLAHGAEADDVHLRREAGDGRGPESQGRKIRRSCSRNALRDENQTQTSKSRPSKHTHT